MPHGTALIATVAGGLGLAFLLGLLAVRLKLPAIVGYLLAGVAVGPFTPGFVADAGLASQLAEIGVILLMFGVGLHFSIADLLAVRRIAVPGAIVQIAVATGLGALVSHFWGWSWTTGLVFGLSLSVASTVVLLRALEDRSALRSEDGRIAVGWLIVEDLATVLALVMLPALAGVAVPENAGGGAASQITAAAGGSWLVPLGWTLGKLIVFVALMLVVGKRAIPWLLGRVARTGSRELFTLAVLATALGIAVGAAALFGVSFALGAFFAGIVVSESKFSQEAATSALPLQDAFAVLFFVSVGMLFDPRILVQKPLELFLVVLIILVGKSVGALAIVLAFRYPLRTALHIAGSLAQIGEFSFILVALGVSLRLLPPEAQSLVVAGALITITLNPFVLRGADWLADRLSDGRDPSEAVRSSDELAILPVETNAEPPEGHAVIVGHGRVGGPIAADLVAHGVPVVIIEQGREIVANLRKAGLPAMYGDATRPDVLAAAFLTRARLLVIAVPDGYQVRAILAAARRLQPELEILVRTESDAEGSWLEKNGAVRALVPERELAASLARVALQRLGVSSAPGMTS